MRVVGLTGSIACGKSTVSAYLMSLGYPVVDGDRISRQLTVSGSPALREIREVFGPEILYDDGSLNRRRLGQIVFRDPSARALLDNLLAPYLLDAIRAGIEDSASHGAPLCFLDMPLLFEKGYDRLCDSVWTVWLPPDLQLSRLMERDGYTRDEALSRIQAVLSSDEKAGRSDYVIDNSGSPDHTRMIVSGLVSEELKQATRTVSSPVSYPDGSELPPDSQGRNIPSGTVHPEPPVMERPKAASAKRNTRKAQWRMPVWLKSSLVILTAVLLIGTTSIILMNAYLYRRQEEHIAEQKEIDRQYPLLYREMIEKYAAEYNLSPAFVSAIIRNESSFQPRAESDVGARGLMQLMPDTAEWIAGKLKIRGYAFERMYDPESNIQFGCWYLNYLSRLFLGDPVSVAAAYHAGQGQVKTWLSDPMLSEDGWSIQIDALPEGPTKKYAGRVIRDYGIYMEKYFADRQPDADSDAFVPSGHKLRGNR